MSLIIPVYLYCFCWPRIDAVLAGNRESRDARHIATPEPIAGNTSGGRSYRFEPADGLRRRASAGSYAGDGHEGGFGRAGDCGRYLNPAGGAYADPNSGSDTD